MSDREIWPAAMAGDAPTLEDFHRQARLRAQEPWPPPDLDRRYAFALFGPCPRCDVGVGDLHWTEPAPGKFRMQLTCVDCGYTGFEDERPS
jgi:hypothetical protein